ncbi:MULTISPECIES: AraC family transcriptional regulator [unclassified Rhizobium]|jgi:AraC-like DNA-binding protein|uniref:AraC family transcriptional regulator n=1 Tax=unclassified Rhizobium TaxID=2613769 RepID=UPI000646BCDD|nr:MULTISPECIES: AraC family transcriptional regulator [unclassified Rhizobium]MBN8954671.1 AraC family transcriptional regulator [Rhizobium tropici]OJY75452.1 MAG: AraC family transcriptional regulator [Rhizobium sp. 60-20]RKD70529.1 AraC-like DNA-binding protein [Rhizobium sp. WW_1]
MEPSTQLRELISRHAVAPKQATGVQGLTLYKVGQPTLPTEIVYSPRICMVLQGTKEIRLAERVFSVGSAQYFIATVNLPVSARIEQADPIKPHLALTFELDREEIAKLLAETPSTHGVEQHDHTGIAVSQHTPEIVSAALRLVSCLDAPDDFDMMVKLARLELYYRLLRGELGPMLRQLATQGTNLAQIGRVTEWIKGHFAEAMSIGKLADMAGMSQTSLHRHFKAVTLMTPLQYRALIRLQEARRRLLLREASAREIGFEVGYDSQTQFTREYRKLFGRPPAADAAFLGGR